ncbi:MAG: hypothetical protein ACRDI3_09055 [Actinomycetota bacterium]
MIPMLYAVRGGLETVDLAYHVRAGLDALAQGSLVWSDSFTFTAPGTTWVNQQWFAQLVLAGTFQAWGFVGLLVLKTIMVGFLFSLVFSLCRASGASLRVASWVTLGAFGVAMTTLTLRPQLFAMCLFALALRILQNRTDRPGVVWWLVPLTVLWANVHGSFVLVLLLLVVAKLQDRLNRAQSRITLPLFASVLVATLLNPAGPWIWPYVIGLVTHPMMALVVEWQPPQVTSPTGFVFFCSVAAVGVLLARRPERVRWSSLVPLAVFFGLALLSQRSVAWWAIVAAPAVAVIVGRRSGQPGERRLLNTAMGGAFAFIVLMGMASQIRGSGVAALHDAPGGITRYLRHDVEPSDRMFNPQRWGSWFELALPEHKTFVDSRIEFFSESVWADYLGVVAGAPGWERVLQRWQINVVVVDHDTMHDARVALEKHPGWTIAYEDHDGSVFRRSRPGKKVLLKR